MKDIYKNPTLYYILVPIMVALWPLVNRGVYLPDVERSLNGEMKQYDDANDVMLEILALDPDRLKFADANSAAAEFDYANVVEKVASFCGIPSTNYKLSSGPIIISGGQRSQSANIVLQDVEITKFAKFLSTIQLRWADLQCVQLRKLRKKKGLPDRWDVDLEFKYYY